MAVSTVSYSNTPQAKDDAYYYSEDELLALPGSQYNSASNILTLDVMSNDLGGNAKKLYSIDDSSGALKDLLSKDIVGAWETTSNGNQIRIVNGKIEFNFSHSLDGYGGSVNGLAEGDAIHDSFVYAIQLANGTLSYATVTIDIIGQNDGPKVASALTVSAVEDGNHASVDLLAGAADVDHGAVLSVTDLPATLPDGVSYDAANHRLSLDPSNAAFQALKDGETTTVTVNYSVSDEHGAKVAQSVTFTITGSNDAPTVAAALSAEASEDGSSASVDLLAGAADVDHGAVLSVTDLPASLPDGVSYDAANHRLSLDPSNAAFQALKDGETTTVTVNYSISDEHGAKVAQSVTFTITGSNDAPTVAAALSADASEDGSSASVDLLAGAADVDHGAVLSVTDLPASLPDGVSYDAANHRLSLDPSNAAFQTLKDGETTTVTVNYSVSDEHGAKVAQSVTFTLTGSNDAPTVAAALSADASEDGSSASVDLLAGAADVDHGAVLSVTDLPATLPDGVSYDATNHRLSLDPSNAAFQALKDGETTTVTVNYSVSDEHGAKVAQSVTFTLTGSNDAPTVAAALSAEASEDGSSASVDLLAGAADVDHGAVLSVTDLPATLPDGVSYDATNHRLSLDPSNAAFQALKDGETTTVTVNYSVSDEHGAKVAQSVTFTITGSNDAPTVAAALSAEASEDGSSASVDLLAGAADVDHGAVLSVTDLPATLPAGVSYDAANHSLSLDPSNAAFQALKDGETTTVTVNYSVSDEHGAKVAQSVTFTLTGSNDTASISGVHTGVVTEASASVVGSAYAEGTLLVVDADAGQSAFGTPASLGGTYGNFSFDATSGKWSYQLDNSRSMTEQLSSNQQVHDYLTVYSADGSALQTIDVTINGTTDNSQPVLNSGILFNVNEHLLNSTTNPNGFLTSPSVAINAQDADGDSLSYTLLSDSSGGAFAVSSSGVVTVKDLSLLDYEGASLLSDGVSHGYALQVQVSDGHSDAITQTLYVKVNDVSSSTNNSNGTNYLDGNNSGETLSGGGNTDYIFGDGGNDTLNGDGSGTPKEDWLYGGSGDDTLQGNQGNDFLFGGSGNDTFKWSLADLDTSGNPTVYTDTVKDWGSGDKLDLKDLLSGEHSTASSLDSYLDFSYNSSTGNTTIAVHKDGGSAVNQYIVLEGVHLAGNDDQAIISNLLNNNQLKVDV